MRQSTENPARIDQRSRRRRQKGKSNELAFQSLEDRRLLAQFVGVDFDVGDTSSPVNWNSFDLETMSTILNLRGEDNVDTPFDLEVVGPGGDQGTVSFSGSEAIAANTLPSHAPSLAALDGVLFAEGTPRTVNATWSDLTPGATYEVYVFGLDSPGFGSSQSVSINSGVTIFNQNLTTSGSTSNLWINGQQGSNQPLENFAVNTTANAAGEIDIAVTSTIGSVALGGLALREVGFFVNSTADADDGLPTNGSTTLREAINLANTTARVDTIRFSSLFDSQQTINLTSGELEITNPLTIEGPGQDLLTIDARQMSRVLNFSKFSDDLTLEGLTLTGGLTSGSGSEMAGGGIRSRTNGNLTLTDVAVTGNSTAASNARGGGIFAIGSTVSLTNSTVSGNSTAGSGAAGGGIYTQTGDVILTSSTVSGNRTARSNANGGGIFSPFGDVSLISSTVNGNSASGPFGGGIFTNSGDVSLVGSTVSGNTAAGSDARGGGIVTSSGDVSLLNSTLSENTITGARARGGGIAVTFGDLSLTSSTISSNSATGSDADGGAISSDIGDVNIVSSTVTNNSATRAGGGVFMSPRDPMGRLFTIENSIVARNVAANNDQTDLSPDPGSTMTINRSLIGVLDVNAQPVFGNQGIQVGTAANPLDPLLGPLLFNGGPTKTHALLSGSPALDTIDGQLHYYRFDGNTIDSTGSNNGTNIGVNLNAPTDVPGSTSAAQFDPVLDSRIALSDQLDAVGGNSNTIEAWVKVPSNASDRVGSILGNFTSSNNAPFANWEIHDDGQVRVFWDTPTTSSISLFGTTDLRDDQWHHVAFVRDTVAGQFRAYIDGVVEPLDGPGSTSNSAGPNLNFTNTHLIGNDHRLTTIPFQGAIDELVIYNRVLSEGEIFERAQGNVDQRGAFWKVDGDFETGARPDMGAFERQTTNPFGDPPVVTSFFRDEGGVLNRPDIWTSVTATFDIDVNVQAEDLILRELFRDTLDTSGITFSYNSATRTAHWDLSSLMLPPDYYSVELSSDITSVAGNLGLDGDEDGNPGGDYVEQIYVALPGDANLDGQVNVLGDAFALVSNLDTTGGATWAQGDFNGDGNVNVLGDAFILVGQLGQGIVILPSPLTSIVDSPTTDSAATVSSVPSSLAILAKLEHSIAEQKKYLKRQSIVPSASSTLTLAGSQALDRAFESSDLTDADFFA